MSYSDEIKKIRKKCFLSQEAFGREIGVSFSSINRWEGGKSKPNMAAMKNTEKGHLRRKRFGMKMNWLAI